MVDVLHVIRDGGSWRGVGAVPQIGPVHAEVGEEIEGPVRPGINTDPGARNRKGRI